MSREIKFRAWDKRHTMMEMCHDLYWFEENGLRDVNDANTTTGDYVVMQFTGLKDKNGVEIYEGDIVDFTCGFGSGDGVDIGFERQAVTYIAEGGNFRPLLNVIGGDIEVIGNIYENPELVATKQ